MSLTEFLLARIAEDEAAVRTAGVMPGMAMGYEPDPTPSPVLLVAPARVLAECEVKRRIVALHQPDERGEPLICRECGGFVVATPSPTVGIRHSGYVVPWPCPTIRALAQPFADHPDFDPAWRL